VDHPRLERHPPSVRPQSFGGKMHRDLPARQGGGKVNTVWLPGHVLLQAELRHPERHGSHSRASIRNSTVGPLLT